MHSRSNRFYKNVDQLANSIEEMVDKLDESSEVLFLGEMIRNTIVFNKVKRSIYGTGCRVFKNILECREGPCFLTTANECFRKYVEKSYKKDFSREYRDFTQTKDRFKKIMT